MVLLPAFVNHIEPSGPGMIRLGWLILGSLKSPPAMGLGSNQKMAGKLVSANQRMPPGPVAMSLGFTTPGRSYPVTEPVGVMLQSVVSPLVMWAAVTLVYQSSLPGPVVIEAAPAKHGSAYTV